MPEVTSPRKKKLPSKEWRDNRLKTRKELGLCRSCNEPLAAGSVVHCCYHVEYHRRAAAKRLRMLRELKWLRGMAEEMMVSVWKREEEQP